MTMVHDSPIALADFRGNERDYARSQAQWQQVFRAALALGDQQAWEDWIADQLRDGSPIFSKVNRRTKQGIIVHQVLPADDSLEFRAYLGRFGSAGFGDAIEHLTIVCMLTRDSKQKATDLIRKFAVDHLPVADIARLCAELTNGSPEAATTS